MIMIRNIVNFIFMNGHSAWKMDKNQHWCDNKIGNKMEFFDI